MTAAAATTRLSRPAGVSFWLIMERNFMIARRQWLSLVSGFFEPVFYLAAVAVGFSALIPTAVFGAHRTATYTAFVAPALLATSAMNGALYDATVNMFFKLKSDKVYESIKVTPIRVREIALGEIAWAVTRGAVYAAVFSAVMALTGNMRSAWGVLAVPAAVLIGFAFAAVGLAATTYARNWQDMGFIGLAGLPMFLFSTTFYPLSVYPSAVGDIVRCSPLYQSIELVRDLALGAVDRGTVGHVVYLLAMGCLGVTVASRRMERLLLK